MKIRNLLVLVMMAVATALSVNAQEPPERMEMGDEMDDRPFIDREQGEMSKPGMRGEKPFKNRTRFERKTMMGKDFGMPPEMEDMAFDIIKKNDPSFAEKLAGLKESNPRKYEVIMGIAARFLTMVKKAEEPALEKDVVRGISLEYDVRQLSLEYEKASDSEKGKIKDSIKTKLDELFDIRAKGQEMRIKKMEKEISKLKANIEKRRANKSKIVERRLNDLVGSKDLSW